MLSLSNLFLKDYKVNYSRLKHILENDFSAYEKIKKWFDGKRIEKKRLVIYSPGCGSDFATMFAIYDSVASEKNTEAVFVVLDFRDFFTGMVNQARLLLPTARISVKEFVKPGTHIAEIKFKGKSFRIIYYVRDFLSFFPEILKNNIDLYYERAFELFRSRDNISNYRVYKNMKLGSLMISDFGFDFASQRKKFVQLKKIPKDFGLYQKFQIWQRKYD